jgi:thiamine-phosphate pyrophosphorylase
MLPRLYPILDVDLCRERRLEPLAVLAAFLAGGATFLQLRDKSPSTAGRLALADAVVAQAHAAGARVIINDRVDVARLAGADGVHVGQEDLAVDDARRILGPDAIVGLSTHDERQIEAAARTTATYVAVGPIYGTATKETGYSARGLDLVRLAVLTLRQSPPRRRSLRQSSGTAGQARPAGQAGRPVVAIGGITLERAPEVLAAGAASVAVISDLLREDPATMIRSFRQRLGETADKRDV